MEQLVTRNLGFEAVSMESRLTLYKLYVTWFLLCSAFAVLLTTLPLVLVDIVGAAQAPVYQGWLASTTAMSGLVLCATMGHLSDKYGRTTILRVWSFAFATGIVLVLVGHYVQSVVFLFVARLPAMSVPFFISSALCADVVQGPFVLQSHGHLGAIFGLAAVAGSILAGVIGHLGGLMAAVLCGLFLGLAGLVIALNTPVTPVAGASEQVGFIEAVRIVFRDKLLRLVVLAFALTRVGNVNVTVVYILYAKYRFNWTIFELSIMMAVRGAISVYFQFAATAYLAKLPPRAGVVAQHWLLGLHPLTMIMIGGAWDSTTFAIASLINTVTFVSISLFTAKIAALSHRDGISGLALGSVGTLQNFIEVAAAVYFGSLLRRTITEVPPDSFWAGQPFYVNALWYAVVSVIFWYADKYHHAALNGVAESTKLDSEDEPSV